MASESTLQSPPIQAGFSYLPKLQEESEDASDSDAEQAEQDYDEGRVEQTTDEMSRTHRSAP